MKDQGGKDRQGQIFPKVGHNKATPPAERQRQGKADMSEGLGEGCGDTECWAASLSA